jgi:hypothetical protein
VSDWHEIATAAVEVDTAFRHAGVLLYIPTLPHPIRHGFWRNTDKRWGWYGSLGIRDERKHRPTHWQPLPESPKSPSGSEQR